jgi:hypothetical protein
MTRPQPLASTEEDVRRLALSLPEVVEKPSYGTPGFRVRDRLFARVQPEEDAVVVWRENIDEKHALIESEPARFCSTPHYDGHPTVLVRLATVGTDELWEILAESWRVRAPKKVRDRFDASPSQRP